MDRLLTIPQVCEALGLGRTTVYGLLDQGRLDRVEISNCRRALISKSSVERLVNASKKGVQ